jgi:hypothetical protein
MQWKSINAIQWLDEATKLQEVEKHIFEEWNLNHSATTSIQPSPQLIKYLRTCGPHPHLDLSSSILMGPLN